MMLGDYIKYVYPNMENCPFHLKMYTIIFTGKVMKYLIFAPKWSKKEGKKEIIEKINLKKELKLDVCKILLIYFLY